MGPDTIIGWFMQLKMSFSTEMKTIWGTVGARDIGTCFVKQGVGRGASNLCRKQPKIQNEAAC